MAVNVLQYEPKIERLLSKFLEPDFQIRNDFYLNNFLSHLSGKVDRDLGNTLINRPILTEWLLQAITVWETTRTSPESNIASFTLHLTGLLAKDESRFLYFKSNNIFNRLCVIFKARNAEAPPIIKLGYIKMLSSFLEHKYGIEYITATDFWKDALEYSLTNQTVYITRDGYSFVYKMLEKCTMHELFVNAVIKQIFSKLTQSHFENGPSFPEIKEENLTKKLTPTLNLITFILESFYQSEAFKDRIYSLPLLLFKTNDLEHIVWNLARMVHNKDLLLDLDKILMALHFFSLAFVKTEKFTKNDLSFCIKNVFKIINDHFTKGHIENSMKLCCYAHHIWQFLKHRAQPEESESFRLDMQILALQIVPLFMVSIKHCNVTVSVLDMDDLRNNYALKLTKYMSEKTIRTVYNWRTILMEQDVFKCAHLILIYLMKSHKYFSRNTNVMVFQAIMYALKDIINICKTSPAAQELFSKETNYMVTLVDAISTLINNYSITWKDCIESICVMSCSVDLLSSPHWVPRLTVRILKLLNSSILKFLSPNLALLVDKGSDSTLDILGPTLYMKLHDRSWEVRDTALEVVHSISSISQTKFLSFQKMILDTDLLSLVVTMSISDSESFVRASAIKCLQEMIIVREFWTPILENKSLPEKMMKILKNETEAIVRCEAASLICKIYEHRHFSDEILHQIYDTMSQTAIIDLHWEVKLNALDFWEKVIVNHLQNQGMIDGSFPNVTFSKEHRKIVTLNDAEVQNRLNKVLIQLSECRCLTVLVTAMRDDCDIEVSKKAVSIANKLAGLLKNYKVTVKSQVNKAVSPTSSGFDSPLMTQRIDLSEDVLDEIVNANDLNLLSNVYSPEGSDSGISGGLEMRPIQNITPEAFAEYVRNDLDAIVSERIKWLKNIDNLNSLLDDMLKSYEDDMNSMDCY